MIDPVLRLPSGDRNYRRSISGAVAKDGNQSAQAIRIIVTKVAEGILEAEIDGLLDERVHLVVEDYEPGRIFLGAVRHLAVRLVVVVAGLGAPW